ncbi:MAG TPA: hypothetical protein VKE22_10595 [Haliangiales bacterium]|nr:hypothetical protein [Haliangiales bacterium]
MPARACAFLLWLVCSTAAADERTVDSRPWFARFDAGLGSPVGFLGATVGRAVAPGLAVEVGGGLGGTGYQAAVLARGYIAVGDSESSSWTLAGGPSLAMLGESLGLAVTHRNDIAVARGDLFYVAGVNVEAGYELRFAWGGIARVAVGGFVTVSENMAALCAKDPGSDAEPAGCEPPGPDAIPSGPQVARRRAYPYFVLGFGFAW